jgi:hypothetical protein
MPEHPVESAHDPVARLLAARAAQGLPEFVTDAGALARIAAVVRGK